jgi:hypothetical protein
MATSPSLDLFVSHSSADVDLVEPLVDLLQDALGLEPDRIRATSIDGYRLPAGIPFEEALRRETHDARAFIGVISPAGLDSTYVAFELGSRWGANRHLVPLLTPEVTSSALKGPLAALNAMRVDDRAQLQQLITDLATELNIKARAPHQYSRQLERLLTASAHRSQAPVRQDARPEPETSGESDLDYPRLVESFDVLMDLQRRVMEGAPDHPITSMGLEKIQSAHDSVKQWIRANRLQAKSEITRDADLLLGMLQDERRAFLHRAAVAFSEDPGTVFARLVEQVRSERMRP